MPIKVYKRTNASRSIADQDKALAKLPVDFIYAPVFYDDDINSFTRATTRKEPDTIYAGSFALFADDDKAIREFLRACKKRGHTLIGAEEEFRCTPGTVQATALHYWREARRAGAAIRGASISAATKKAKTAAAFAKIDHELKATKIPSKELLSRVGIRAIGSIRNHYGKCREDLQRDYQAALKRAERRKAKAV